MGNLFGTCERDYLATIDIFGNQFWFDDDAKHQEILPHLKRLRGNDPALYLVQCIEYRRPRLLELGLEIGFNPNQVCVVPNASRPLLNFAAAIGDVKSVKILLHHGANIHARSVGRHVRWAGNETALDEARYSKEVSMVLLQNGAKLTRRNYHSWQTNPEQRQWGDRVEILVALLYIGIFPTELVRHLDLFGVT